MPRRRRRRLLAPCGSRLPGVAGRAARSSWRRSLLGAAAPDVLRALGVFGASGDPRGVSPFGRGRRSPARRLWLLESDRARCCCRPRHRAGEVWRANRASRARRLRPAASVRRPPGATPCSSARAPAPRSSADLSPAGTRSPAGASRPAPIFRLLVALADTTASTAGCPGARADPLRAAGVGARGVELEYVRRADCARARRGCSPGARRRSARPTGSWPRARVSSGPRSQFDRV